MRDFLIVIFMLVLGLPTLIWVGVWGLYWFMEFLNWYYHLLVWPM